MGRVPRDERPAGTFLMIRSGLPFLRAAGGDRSVVNVSSVAGQIGAVTTAMHYAASKAAILAITRSFARLLAPERIRVNAVTPGPIDSSPTAPPRARRARGAGRIRAARPLRRAGGGRADDRAARLARVVVHHRVDLRRQRRRPDRLTTPANRARSRAPGRSGAARRPSASSSDEPATRCAGSNGFPPGIVVSNFSTSDSCATAAARCTLTSG